MEAEKVLEIQKHIGRAPDFALINTATFAEDLVAKYQAEGDHPILNNCVGEVCAIEARPFASKEEVVLGTSDVIKRSLIRHDSDLLADALISILNKEELVSV